MMEKFEYLLIKYKLVVLIFLISLVLIIILLIWLSGKKIVSTNKKNNNILICPIRGILKKKKYAANGNYSEEYQTIRLVKWFLRKGWQKKQIDFEHVIRIGRDGHNSLRVDLIVKKSNKIFAVAEVKNNSKEIESAINHQLLPAMNILGARHGIYFDGSKKSCIYTRKNNGSLIRKVFP